MGKGIEFYRIIAIFASVLQGAKIARKMKILILNGPNLNLQGRRDRDIYGTRTFGEFYAGLAGACPGVEFAYAQSNLEGELVEAVQRAEGAFDGVVLNAGGYTHTSVALRDAVAAVEVPVVEVHISSILAREEFRHVSLLAPVAIGSIMGFGLDSYRLGVEALLLRLRGGEKLQSGEK